MTRNARNLSVSLPADLLQLLRQAAYDDNRSVSSLVTALVRNHLDREGYLAAAGLRKAPRQPQLNFERRG